MSTQEKLEAIRNRSTKYEVVAVRGDHRILICYTNAHSRHGLLRACQAHGNEIIKAFGISDEDSFVPAKKAADGFTIGNWCFRFSGRTQRDVYSTGSELTFIDDLARVA